MKPICVTCQRFYRPKKNGIFFIEGMPKPSNSVVTPPGTEAPHRWEPYKLWSGDLWQCKGCGHELISGVGAHPISEHYKSDFNAHIKDLGATFQVNDC